MNEEPEINQKELLAWCREVTVGPHSEIKPAQVQRRFRTGWNASCAALEALERDGDLERLPASPVLAWRLAAPAQRPGNGYALPLSPKEHGALMRLLDAATQADPAHLQAWNSFEYALSVQPLRTIRNRMKRPGKEGA